MSINAYNQHLVKQSDPEELFIRAFDTIARKIEKAKEATANKDINTTHIEMCKAHNILNAMILSIADAVEKEDAFCTQLNEYIQIIYRQLIIFEDKKDIEMGLRTLAYIKDVSNIWREEKTKRRTANQITHTSHLTEKKIGTDNQRESQRFSF